MLLYQLSCDHLGLGIDSGALVPTRKEARQAAERRVLELEAELRRRQ